MPDAAASARHVQGLALKPPAAPRCVLLLGGAGFIGRNLAQALGERRHRVLAIDAAAGTGALPAESTWAMPLADHAAVLDLVRRHEVDTVIHLASALLPSSGAEAFAQEVTEVLAPSFALMDGCAREGIRFVLFSSGGTVYGDPGPQPVREDHALAPKSRYGLAKVMLEEYARLCHRSLGLQYLVLRPSNPYGRHQRLAGAQGLLAVALGRVLASEAIEVWGDGEAVRDYLDVRDLADAVVQLIGRGVSNATLNVGSGVGHSVNEVLELVQRTSGRKLQIQRRPARRADVDRIVLDTSALRATIDWQPRSLQEGLADFHRSLLAGHAR